MLVMHKLKYCTNRSSLKTIIFIINHHCPGFWKPPYALDWLLKGELDPPKGEPDPPKGELDLPKGEPDPPNGLEGILPNPEGIPLPELNSG